MTRLKHAAAAVLIALAATAATAAPGFDELHGLDTDLLHWLREQLAPQHADPDSSAAVVIAIDQATYANAPFDGTPKVMWTPQIAAVQDAVLDAGATVFAWDLVLPTSANTYLADKRYDKPLLVSLLRQGRQAGKVILGDLKLGTDPIEPFEAFQRAVGGYRNIRSLNAFVDPDGVLRGAPALLTFRAADGTESLRPSMSLEIAQRHLGEEAELSDDGALRFNGREIPYHGAYNLIANFDGGAGAIPTYSFYDVHRCLEAGNTAYLQEHFAGKAVLFGLVLDLEDRKLASNRFINRPDFAGAPATCSGAPVPVSPIERSTMAGIYLHATAVNNLIRGTAIERVPPPVHIAFTALAALAAAAAAMRLKPGRAALAALGVGAGVIAIDVAAFREALQLPLIDPLAAGVLALGGVIGFRFVTTDREQRRVRATFSHYLDPKVIDAMLARGDVPELGGESRELTCFFSDIAAFSSLSEKMTPAELVAFLNDYFAIVGREIEAHGGIIERFLGDAVCAVFGAPVSDPDHAQKAVACALAIDRGLAQAQADGRFALPHDKTVRTRIGINTGPMTVGNVGSQRRYTYTVMGDDVNLAARLESGAKQFGVLLMAGEKTVEATGDRFVWRELDRVRVVGRDRPVTLYEPLGEAGAVPEQRLAVKRRYEAALAQARAGDPSGAASAFQSLAAEGDDAAAKAAERMIEIDARIRQAGGDEAWDGVYDLRSK